MIDHVKLNIEKARNPNFSAKLSASKRSLDSGTLSGKSISSSPYSGRLARDPYTVLPPIKTRSAHPISAAASSRTLPKSPRQILHGNSPEKDQSVPSSALPRRSSRIQHDDSASRLSSLTIKQSSSSLILSDSPLSNASSKTFHRSSSRIAAVQLKPIEIPIIEPLVFQKPPVVPLLETKKSRLSAFLDATVRSRNNSEKSSNSARPTRRPNQTNQTESNKHQTSFAVPYSLEKFRERCQLTRSVVAGLPNLGNTCYMNAALQCLISNKLFVYFVMHETIKENSALAAFKELVQAMREEKGVRTSATKFKTVTQKKIEIVQGYDQQDSGEFVHQLLQLFHTEVALKGLDIPTDFKPMSIREEAILKMNQFLKQDAYSFINGIHTDFLTLEMFCGQTLSKIVCGHCGHQINTFDTFMTLCLSMPTSRANLTLEELLNDFSHEETLQGYKCDKCSKAGTCVRTQTLTRLPRTLIVHLLRFQTSSYGYVRKNNLKVAVPFDLNIPSRCIETEARHGDATSHYELRGVIEHFGDVGGGHFISITKDDNGWNTRDDGTVTPNKGTFASPYILFFDNAA